LFFQPWSHILTKDSDQKERMEWHNVVFFRKPAEIAGEYLSKGSSAYVEGSLKTEKWEDRDGNKKQITKVICSKLMTLKRNREDVRSWF
jgi:single-strand DNA-binding protein